MPNKVKITPEYIRSLTPQEWQAFRVDSWHKKQEYYAKPMPDWYLRDRKSYADFLNRYKKRQEFVASGQINSNPKSLTQKVDILAGDDVDSFADE